MKISIIGCGEVGRCYANFLFSTGNKIVLLCDQKPTDATVQVAAAVGAELVTTIDARLAESDLVISAVFGGIAHEVANEALPFMKANAIYADFTTADPVSMIESAAQAERLGLRFVDVAITGAIALTQGATPLLCAGDGAEAVQTLMRASGAPIKIAGKRAGDASTLKLLRSIFTKGLEALSVECLVAAEKKGLRSELYDVLSDIDQMSLKTFMESSVLSHVVHAPRRLKEVMEAKRQMEKDHIEPLALNGVQALFQRTTNALQSAPAIEKTVPASLAWLSEQAQIKA